MRINPIKSVLSSDLTKSDVSKRYEVGTVVTIAGGIAEIEVGARLPDGTPQTLRLPVVTGFNPAVGQVVGILYANDNLNGAYVVACGDSLQIDPRTLNNTWMAITLVAAQKNSDSAIHIAAITRNNTGANLYVWAVSASCTQNASHVDVDCKINGTSIMTPLDIGETSVDGPAILYNGVLAATPTVIAPLETIALWAHTTNNNGYAGLNLVLWCTAALP
jgi:hypothetical protein